MTEKILRGDDLRKHDFDVCFECPMPAQTRGLCFSCYQRARRDGVLDDYPTKDFATNMEKHARWLLDYGQDILRDVAVEYGLRIVERE